MGLLPTRTDERLSPWAYIAQKPGHFDRPSLFEVREVDGATVVLENCATGFHLRTTRSEVLSHYQLVRAAPAPAADPALELAEPPEYEPHDYDGA